MSREPKPRRPRTDRALMGDEGGAAGIYIAATTAVMLGAVALVIDLGRFMTLHTELQHAADAAALAGAAELDRQPGAQDRARAAITSGHFGTNAQTFAAVGRPTTATAIRFLSTLPADGEALAPYETADDAQSRFLEVTVGPRVLDNALIGFVGGPASLTATASAVAAGPPAVCSFPSLMICNPFETNGGEPFPPDDQVRGVAVKLKFQGAGAAWGPGAFGLLDTADGSQATKDLQTNVGSSEPRGCYGPTVDIRPGQTSQPIRNAINTRFDIYENTMKSARNDWSFRPARNVVKGRVKKGKDCNALPDDPSTVRAMPPDDCFFAGTCDRFGDGDWDRKGYWEVNHPGLPLPMQLQGASRYDVYRHEIANNLIPDNEAAGGEKGRPQCSMHAAAVQNDPIDRRLLQVAVINCRGGVKNNRDIPVEAFLNMFLVRPIQQEKLTSSDPTPADQAAADSFVLWGEIVGRLRPGVDDELRTHVQLHR